MKFNLGALGRLSDSALGLRNRQQSFEKRALAETIFGGEQQQTEGYCPRRNSKAKPA